MIDRRFAFECTPDRPSAHAASVCALDGGHLLATWFAGSREGAPDVAILGAGWSGGAWSAPSVLADTPGCSDGNSVPWTDGAGRLRLWYVTMEGRGWATCPVRERRSDDGGRTWGAPRFIRERPGWMVRNEPLRLGARLVMPMYDERDWTSFMLVSDDGGETWQRSQKLRVDGVGVIQPAIAGLDDGRLLAFMRSTGGRVYASRSADATALTWTAPAPLDLPNPNSAVELIRLRSGALLCVFNPTEHGRSPLRVALSGDDGATWPAWRDLETAPGEFSYPTALQTDDGLIHVLYTHQRRAIAHAVFDEAWVR